MSVYAIADLHGRLDLWNKVKEYLNPGDTLYILGDVADRGQGGYSIICDITNHLRIDNPAIKYIYIRGNHDEMFYQAAKEYYESDYANDDWMLWMNNGGYTTSDPWLGDGAQRWIPALLHHQPCYTMYTNIQNQIIHLSHSGSRDIKDMEGLLWDREHIYREKPDSFSSNEFVVHGHTPIISKSCWYLVSDITSAKRETGKISPYHYCGGHKICIDLGAVATGVTCLLNLDTWEEIIIEADEDYD